MPSEGSNDGLGPSPPTDAQRKPLPIDRNPETKYLSSRPSKSEDSSLSENDSISITDGKKGIVKSVEGEILVETPFDTTTDGDKILLIVEFSDDENNWDQAFSLEISAAAAAKGDTITESISPDHAIQDSGGVRVRLAAQGDGTAGGRAQFAYNIIVQEVDN